MDMEMDQDQDNLLKKLGWSKYKFWQESGLCKGSAYNISNGKYDSGSSLLAEKWLKAEIKIKELEEIIAQQKVRTIDK